jgi:hypothetical protein
MAIFREGKYRAPCDRCGRAFDPVKGGLCAECRKLLCSEHLHGGLVRRALVAVGVRPVCVHCRATGRGKGS